MNKLPRVIGIGQTVTTAGACIADAACNSITIHYIIVSTIC